MKLHIRTLMILGTVMLMFFISTNSAQAFDLDPGDGGAVTPYIQIEVLSLRLANDGDIFGPGEIYMNNPGTQYWTYSYAQTWYGGSEYVSPGVYIGTPHSVYRTVSYRTESFSLNNRYWFSLMDYDGGSGGGTYCWEGYVEIRAKGHLEGSTVWSKQGNGVYVDVGPVRVFTNSAKYRIVGGGATTYHVYNQLYFRISYYNMI